MKTNVLYYAWYSYLARDTAMTPERVEAMNRLTAKRAAVTIYDAEGFEVILSQLSKGDRERLRRMPEPASYRPSFGRP